MSDYERLGHYGFLLRTAMILSSMMFFLAIFILITGYLQGAKQDEFTLYGGFFFTLLGCSGVYLFYKVYGYHQETVNENIKKEK